jgi:hypothetical protein
MEFLQILKGATKVISEFLGVSTKVYPYQKKIIKMQKIIEDLKQE